MDLPESGPLEKVAMTTQIALSIAGVPKIPATTNEQKRDIAQRAAVSGEVAGPALQCLVDAGWVSAEPVEQRLGLHEFEDRAAQIDRIRDAVDDEEVTAGEVDLLIAAGWIELND